MRDRHVSGTNAGYQKGMYDVMATLRTRIKSEISTYEKTKWRNSIFSHMYNLIRRHRFHEGQIFIIQETKVILRHNLWSDTILFRV